MSADADGSSYNYYYNAEGVDFRWQPDESERFPPRLEASLRGQDTQLKRRPDDASADAIIRRIDTFLDATRPLIRYFEASGNVLKINADQSIDAVWADIRQALEKL